MAKAEYHYVPVPDGGEMSTDPQHQAMQGHILACDTCRRAVESEPAGLGQKTKMCNEYLQIALWFSQGHEIGSG